MAVTVTIMVTVLVVTAVVVVVSVVVVVAAAVAAVSVSVSVSVLVLVGWDVGWGGVSGWVGEGGGGGYVEKGGTTPLRRVFSAAQTIFVSQATPATTQYKYCLPYPVHDYEPMLLLTTDVVILPPYQVLSLRTATGTTAAATCVAALQTPGGTWSPGMQVH